MTLTRLDPLARLDAHISRCDCGAWRWDATCSFCALVEAAAVRVGRAA